VTTYVALLRGINMGGHKLVAMADLRALLSRLGFLEPRSLLQSGNLVFGSRGRSSARRLEGLLETEAAKRLALETRFFVRTAAEWRTIVGRNPFREEAERDPGHLVVLFLKNEPRAGDVRALQAAITGREVARVVGRQAYVVYPDGIGTSRLTTAVIDRALSSHSTGRNWNTVRKVEALLDA